MTTRRSHRIGVITAVGAIAVLILGSPIALGQVVEIPPPPVDGPVPELPEEAAPVADGVAPESNMVCNSVAVALVDVDLVTQLLLPVLFLGATGTAPPRVVGTSPWFANVRRPCAAFPIPERSSECSPDAGVAMAKEEALAADPTGAGGVTAVLGLPDVRVGGAVDGVAAKESAIRGASGQQLPILPSDEAGSALECDDRFSSVSSDEIGVPAAGPTVHGAPDSGSADVLGIIRPAEGGLQADADAAPAFSSTPAAQAGGTDGAEAALSVPGAEDLAGGEGLSDLMRWAIVTGALALVLTELLVQRGRANRAAADRLS